MSVSRTMMKPTPCARVHNAHLTPLMFRNPEKRMITRRDVVVAFIAIGVTLGVVAVADQKALVMQSSAFDWNSIPVKPTPVGSTRSFFRTPTATLDELELHVT